MEHNLIDFPLGQSITLDGRINLIFSFFKLDSHPIHLEIFSSILQLKSGILYFQELFHVIL